MSVHRNPRGWSLFFSREVPQATPKISCKGCGRQFSAVKYRRSHLSQSTDPRCQAERQVFLSRRLPEYFSAASPARSASPPSSSRSASPPSSPSLPGSGGPIQAPSDHPGTPAQRLPEIFEDDDLLEDNDLLGLDGASDGNENEDLGAESDIDSDTNEDASDDEHGRFLSAEEVANLQGNMWGDVYMDVYPGSHAGAIHSQGIPTTKEFENVLGGPSPNPFAPFNNQTDWELAKWAKLRGPGSTSFTELMGVTGVRFILLPHILFTTNFVEIAV